MRATLKVESEMDIRAERRLDSGPFKVIYRRPVPRTNNYIKADQGYRYDDNSALEKILFLHY